MKDHQTCISDVINKQTVIIKGDNIRIESGVHLDQTTDELHKCVINSMKNMIDKVEISEDTISKIKSESEQLAKSGSNIGDWIFEIAAIAIIMILILYLINRYRKRRHNVENLKNIQKTNKKKKIKRASKK